MKLSGNRGSVNALLLAAVLLFLGSSLISGERLAGTLLVGISSSLMLLIATLTIQAHRKRLLYFAILVILLREGSRFIFENAYLDAIASLASVVFFLLVVFQLIRQVARSGEVDLAVILESVNGYLLVGLSGGILLAMVAIFQSGAFRLPDGNPAGLADFVYFGFVTMTTIGYGEITPVTGLARLVAIAVGISGQLYIAIIIATLVGKYLAQKGDRT